MGGIAFLSFRPSCSVLSTITVMARVHAALQKGLNTVCFAAGQFEDASPSNPESFRVPWNDIDNYFVKALTWSFHKSEAAGWLLV